MWLEISRRLGAFALAASGSAAVISCSSLDAGPEHVARSKAALVDSDVMGFESLSGWTLSSGVASLSTNRTQGAAAFALVPGGWVQLTSAPLTTVSAPTGTLAIDVAMPRVPPNPYWLGTLQVSVSMPSHGLTRVSLGQTDLGTLALGKYNTIRYAVPAAVRAAIDGTYSDLQFIVVINVPSSTTAMYLMDNLRFLGDADAGAVDAGEAGPVDAGEVDAGEADAGEADAGEAGPAADSGSACGACPSGTGCAPNGLCLPTDLTVWPNVQSQANSDPWLAQHHDSIRDLRPQVLAINFSNHPNVAGATTFGEMLDTVNNHMIPGLAEGSRYHGYSNPDAPAVLHYGLLKTVDLSNPTQPAPSGWNHLNSSVYPRKCAPPGTGYQFDYSALFSSGFAAYYGIRDPANPATTLGLCSMLQKGIVHEVWIYIDGDPDPWTQNGQNLVCSNGVSAGDFQVPEDLGYKQKYDAQNEPLAGQFDACNGDGDGVSACFSADDVATLNACGRTIRIVYINSTRGAGCAMHSLGHGFEGIARSSSTGGPIAYLWPNWRHFANFDLDTRFGAPFQSWYGVCPPNVSCISFQGSSPYNAISWQSPSEVPSSGTMTPYNQGCGSVHFPPNARGDYDYGFGGTNTIPALDTCAGYGLGPPGFAGDPTSTYLGNEPYVSRSNLANGASYEQLVPDTANACGGGWQIYWRQNFPGFANKATDANGNHMKNWWPFLFY